MGNRFGGKAFKEIDPANNQGLNVVPQLMSKNADEFVWAAQVLADMGYREVNLNLGCPSGTVVAKGKGSGFLRNLDELEAFLSDVCERSPLPVSVKTRLGLENDDEYERVLDLYCRMPLAELIVHPRVQKDRYTGSPRKEFYGETLGRAPFPVAYNGDIFDLEDMDALGGGLSRDAPCDAGAWLACEPRARSHGQGRSRCHGSRTAAFPRHAVCGLCRRDWRQCGLPHEGVVVLRQVRFR